MAAPLLSTAADANSVRVAISTLLDAADLPDSAILDDIYAGRASDQVRGWLVQWGVPAANVPPDTDPAMHRAAILATASYVVQAQPHLLSERLPDSTFTYQAAGQDDTPVQRSRALLAQAEAVLRDGLGLPTTLAQPRTFTKAAGQRGRGYGAHGVVFGAAGGVSGAPYYSGDTPNV